MSTKLKHQQGEQQAGGSNVVAMPTRCTAEGCNKKVDRMNFCTEHYEWFKFGLITKTGQKPTDFDKKYLAFQKKRAA